MNRFWQFEPANFLMNNLKVAYREAEYLFLGWKSINLIPLFGGIWSYKVKIKNIPA